MPKRISLPSSEELFAQPGPRPGRARPGVAETLIAGKAAQPRRARGATKPARGEATAGAVAPAVRVAATVPVPVPTARRARVARPAAAAVPVRPVRDGAERRRPGVGERVRQLQSALRDLPIDSLIDLRDGLEALLGADTVSDAEVERLLSGLTR